MPPRPIIALVVVAFSGNDAVFGDGTDERLAAHASGVAGAFILP